MYTAYSRVHPSAMPIAAIFGHALDCLRLALICLGLNPWRRLAMEKIRNADGIPRKHLSEVVQFLG